MATKTTKKTTKSTSRKSAKKPAKKATKKTTRKKRTVKPTGPNLVIVESPAKARTIGRYLGSDYEVRASMGHVRDLPVRGAGVKIDDEGFHPTYEVIPDKEKVIKELAKLAKKAPTIYLATDLDREGEAIAWHLVEALDVPDDRRARVTFHEITKKAIQEAFSKPSTLNQSRVDAQQARRILDRVVGYPLSRLLSKSISRGMSAGRVQSVAVRLIVDREKEIRAFTSVDYWRVFADLRPQGGAEDAMFGTDLVHVDEMELTALEDAVSSEGSEEDLIEESRGRKLPKSRELRLPSAEIAEALLGQVRSGPWVVESVKAKRKREKAAAPYITSTLQQQGSIRLRWSTKRTMQVAQSLYEGVALGAEGPTGLITYMRTDSVSLAPEAVNACRDFIESKFGKEYLPAKPNFFKSGKGAQEAHEAIRPTDPARTPDSIRGVLGADEYKLYKLIWERFIACQMAPTEVDTTVLRVRSGPAVFEARGRVVAFPGWRAVSPGRKKDEPQLPQVKEGDTLDLVDLRSEQRSTQPPARFSEATLVKRLEKEGIGRPSTYADIIGKIQARKYVTKESGKFHASELGEVMVDRMIPFFPAIMEPSFTRKLEAELDAIEDGNIDWQQLLKRFYKKFEAQLDQANEGMPKLKFLPAEGEDPCEECGKPVVLRFSRGRKFFGCSGYPECKYTRAGDGNDRPKAIPTEHVCEKCGKGMVIRSGRRGKFLACSGYPECRNSKNIAEDGTIIEPEKTGESCEKCGAEMVIKRGRRGPFLACSAFPKCRNARDVGSKPGEGSGKEGPAAPVAQAPLPDCPKCGSPMSLRRSRRGAFCGCTRYPDCKGTAPVPAGALPPRDPPKNAGVDCPSCGKPMVVRKSRRGEFAGCSGYPKCRETKTMEEVAEATGTKDEPAAKTDA